MIFPQLLQYSDVGLFVLRIAIALIFLLHASMKLKNSNGMATAMGMEGKGMMVFGLGVVETVSAIALVVGFYTQLAALIIAIIMIGAIAMKKMKWSVPFAAMDKTGWEFDLVLLAAAITVLLTGGGNIGIL